MDFLRHIPETDQTGLVFREISQKCFNGIENNKLSLILIGSVLQNQLKKKGGFYENENIKFFDLSSKCVFYHRGD